LLRLWVNLGERGLIVCCYVELEKENYKSLPGEFEKHVKKLGLDAKAEKELIDMLNQATSEDPCMSCESNEGCDNFKWHKKWLNTDSCRCRP
jgi:hypothetical protein